MAADHVAVSAESARGFCQAVLERAGLPTEGDCLVADTLVDADLGGVSTHGLVRFPIYVTRLHKGLVTPTPRLRAIRERGATLVLNEVRAVGAEFDVRWPA